MARIADRPQAVAEARPEANFRRHAVRVADRPGPIFRHLLGFPAGFVDRHRLRDRDALRDGPGFHRLHRDALRDSPRFHHGFRNRLTHGPGFHDGFRDLVVHGHIPRALFLHVFVTVRGVRFLFGFVLPHRAAFIDPGLNVFRDLDRPRGRGGGCRTRAGSRGGRRGRCRGARPATAASRSRGGAGIATLVAVEETGQLSAEGGGRCCRQTEQPSGRGGQQTRFYTSNAHDPTP